MKQRSTTVRNGATAGTRAVERALDVLRTIGEARTEPGLSDIADDLGLHKTTVFRLLGALERAEFVVRDEERQRYQLGPALFRLASQARRASGLHEAARAELEALAHDVGETATLEVLVGREVLILDEVHGRFLVGGAPEVGMRWPAHATSTGKVLLAAAEVEGATPGARRRSAPGRLARLGPHTITSRAQLERELAKVRRDGYAVGMEELEPGFVAIGAPVRNAHGRTVAAVSVGGPKARLSGARVRTVAARVRRAADRISRRLGDPTLLHDA
ncbi:MAG TPA: IclR family transcriptional regulator [Gemmatimonadaceae bacterium]|nr:IclR family transcriptional regulator [Gemmatimonadaceae bacterium]